MGSCVRKLLHQPGVFVVRSRSGRNMCRIVDITGNSEVAPQLSGAATTALELPDIDPFVAPILHAIPVQPLVHYVAVTKGMDVDQPRNLAKSITVE